MRTTSSLLHTSTFRLAVLYLVLFGVSSLALLAFIYWRTTGYMARQTDETIAAEITGLAERYRLTGLTGLRNVLSERSRDARQSLYLLVGWPGRAPIVGNLDAWPTVDTAPDGWIDFRYGRSEDGQSTTHDARARHIVLAGGFELLVGRDVEERLAVAELVENALVWSLLLMLLLGLVGGYLISRNTMRRIDGINRTVGEIMAGDLGRRIPVRGSDDELDRLARNLNAMLDRIEALMDGLRQVTESIAHDLRSPLSRIRSRLEVTLMEPPSDDVYREALQRTIEDAEGLLATFNAMLGIARAQAGDKPANLVPVDLTAIAGDVAELYEPVAEEKQIDFRAEVAEGAVVRGDRHLLSQALANLVDNAIKYTPPRGRVRVRARLVGDHPLLEVADDGPGIAAADRDRALERFVRLDASRHTAGSGLGLALVKAVARMHDAELRLADNAPGLRVSLRFPAPPDPSA